jgi:hypothetical protein
MDSESEHNDQFYMLVSRLSPYQNFSLLPIHIPVHLLPGMKP